jgi:hypothetical protein
VYVRKCKTLKDKPYILQRKGKNMSEKQIEINEELKELRRKILELFYEKALKNPNSCVVTREEVKAILSVPDNLIDLNVLYLHGKHLVKIIRMSSHHWETAVIDFDGMDVIEHKEKYVKEFPFMQVTFQHINGNVFGNAIQAVDSQVSFNQQMTDAFKQVYDKLDANKALSLEIKEETKKNLNTLEDELLSKSANLDRIQKSWTWLKQNANWVVPTLTQVVLEGIKRFVG